ncbi:hypothetical protein M3J09_010372 [Ascochyta lentis]
MHSASKQRGNPALLTTWGQRASKRDMNQREQRPALTSAAPSAKQTLPLERYHARLHACFSGIPIWPSFYACSKRAANCCDFLKWTATRVVSTCASPWLTRRSCYSLFTVPIPFLSHSQGGFQKDGCHQVVALGILRGLVNRQGSQSTRGPRHGVGNHHQHLKRAWWILTAHRQLNSASTRPCLHDGFPRAAGR